LSVINSRPNRNASFTISVCLVDCISSSFPDADQRNHLLRTSTARFQHPRPYQNELKPIHSQ
jgi:hypothetical protein